MVFLKKCGILVLSLALAGCGCGSSKKEDKSSQAVSSLSKAEQNPLSVLSSSKETSLINQSKEENHQEFSSTEKEPLELNKLQVLFTQMTPEFTRERLEAWAAENPDVYVNLEDYNGSDTYYLAFDWEDTLDKYRDTRGARLQVSFKDRTNELQEVVYGGDNTTSAIFYNSGQYWETTPKYSPGFYIINKDNKEYIQVTALEALEYQASDGRMQID